MVCPKKAAAQLEEPPLVLSVNSTSLPCTTIWTITIKTHRWLLQRMLLNSSTIWLQTSTIFRDLALLTQCTTTVKCFSKKIAHSGSVSSWWWWEDSMQRKECRLKLIDGTCGTDVRTCKTCQLTISTIGAASWSESSSLASRSTTRTKMKSWHGLSRHTLKLSLRLLVLSETQFNYQIYLNFIKFNGRLLSRPQQ